MRNRIVTVAIYAEAYKNRAIESATFTKDRIIENRAELARLGATAAVVGVAARVVGFKAGYKFAKTN
jgi:hypothetical protein